MRPIIPVLLLLTLSCGSEPEAPAAPPNVVYIQSDTHRWGAMSFTQTPQVQTPNMAKLASQGVSLDRYYINLPICTPYRAIMMTGRWPYQQGLMANHMSLGERVDLPDGEKSRGTIAWAFKHHGYQTGHFGKWHLGGRDARPFGFDKSVVWGGTNNHRECRYSIDGAEYTDWTGLSNSTATTEQALDWIASQTDPFFAVISLNPPHGPFHDAPDAKKLIYPDESALPFHPLDETRDFAQHRDYHALISGVDDDLGMVMARLDELGISDNTILIYTSDHGAMTGIDGVGYGQKRHPNDESSRVPFLARWPGHVPENLRLDILSSTIDVFPTVAGLAGLAPDAYSESLPGLDLSPVLLGNKLADQPESVFLMHPSNMNNRGSRHEIIWRAIVTDEFTYAVTEDGEHRLWENTDGYQKENLLDDPAHLETRRQLWTQLNELMEQAERPFYDTWFDNAAEHEVKAWNAEHGLGEDNPDRMVGRIAVFDLLASEPKR